jgi:uncharacterized protein
VFGFLLQKGGVAKYNVLEGQLRLQDFTVVKVMLTTIVVGMVGIYFLHEKAGTKLHIKPTKLAANVLGGLIFGVGFAMAGYCPRTGAAALGQGDIHALFFMGGLVFGSYPFAEMSSLVKRTVDRWGNYGVGLICVPRVPVETWCFSRAPRISAWQVIDFLVGSCSVKNVEISREKYR